VKVAFWRQTQFFQLKKARSPDFLWFFPCGRMSVSDGGERGRAPRLIHVARDKISMILPLLFRKKITPVGRPPDFFALTLNSGSLWFVADCPVKTFLNPWQVPFSVFLIYGTFQDRNIIYGHSFLMHRFPFSEKTCRRKYLQFAHREFPIDHSPVCFCLKVPGYVLFAGEML